MTAKEKSIKQLSNCDDMHIYVQPIRDYIQELEDDYELVMDLILSIDDDLLYKDHYKLWQLKLKYEKEVSK